MRTKQWVILRFWVLYRAIRRLNHVAAFAMVLSSLPCLSIRKSVKPTMIQTSAPVPRAPQPEDPRAQTFPLSCPTLRFRNRRR